MIDEEFFTGVPEPRPSDFTIKGASNSNTSATRSTSDARAYDEEYDEESVGIPNPRCTEFRRIDPLAEYTPATPRDPEENERLQENAPFGIRQLIASPLMLAAITLAVAGALLVILSEVFQFLEAVKSAPVVVQILAYSFVSILVIMLGLSFARLAIAYRRLRVTPNVDLDAIRQAKRRAVTRDQIQRQVEAGYQSLRGIVSDYPINSDEHRNFLYRCGMSTQEWKTLRSNIETLLNCEAVGQSRWIEDCERLFINLIDNVAKRRVSSYAKRVGLKTAISPTGFVDSLIVFTNSVLMVEELSRLYGVRTTRWQSVILTWRIFFSTFVSAKLEDQIDEFASNLFDGFVHAPQIAKGLLTQFSAGLLTRVAEGGVNMAMFYRLGTATILSLRPIQLSARRITS
jgi:uncharacterized membrane protein YcjF (UPF0283 family)